MEFFKPGRAAVARDPKSSPKKTKSAPNTQATRLTQQQLAYLAYWQKRGYRFGRDDEIPETTQVPPPGMDQPTAVELLVTGGLVLAIILWLSLGGSA